MSKKAVFLTVAIVLVLGASAFWADRQGYYVLSAKNYSVPATSMLPTLEVGDQFFASVVYPGFGETYAPVRGDIIVFKSKRGLDHVKRLIGLPGDTIQMRDGQVVLNGAPLPAMRTADYVMKSDDGTEEIFEKDRITLPNGRSYEVLNVAPDGALDNTREYLVPEGHLFVLGDNLDRSQDSRVLGAIGYIPIKDVTGVARDVYYSGPQREFVWRSLEPDIP